MKSCPYCHIPNCQHERKFFRFGLMKLILLHKSIEATTAVFDKLITFLPTNTEMQGKLSLAIADLKRAEGYVDEVQKWCKQKTL